jgi:hypothetical protein
MGWGVVCQMTWRPEFLHRVAETVLSYPFPWATFLYGPATGVDAMKQGGRLDQIISHIKWLGKLKSSQDN